MKILGLSFNFPKHCDEAPDLIGKAVAEPREPVVFHKGDSILRPGKPFYLPDWSEQIDYEAEIVVMIDRVGKCIAERFAHRYYSRVSIGIDLTARDLQRKAIAKGEPWTMSKAFDNSAVIGEWVDKEALGFPGEPLQLRLDCDGKTVQRALSSEMIHSIDKVIAYLSEQHTLKMGDIIFMGTPHGVGQCRVGQCFEGYLNDQKLLHLEIR